MRKQKFSAVAKRPSEEQTAFNFAFPGSGAYAYKDFKDHVTSALKAKFGDAVKPGKKAIRVEGNGNRPDRRGRARKGCW
jgi:hypothetical protein